MREEDALESRSYNHEPFSFPHFSLNSIDNSYTVHRPPVTFSGLSEK